MLEELRLRGLGAIEQAELRLDPGFTVVTGETGAGKTMLLTGLALLLGGRADSGMIAAGAERLEVDGRFATAPGSAAAVRVAEAGGDVETGEILLSRSVGRDGRSRAHAGGRPVPVGLLAELADDLVTVHGQADQRGLLRPAVQRAVLDRYGGAEVLAALDRYSELFGELRGVDAELASVIEQGRERAREADLLRLGLAEIRAVAPQPGEDAELITVIARLAHVDNLRLATATAAEELADDDRPSAVARLAAAQRSLEAVRGHDPQLDGLAARLAELGYGLADVASELTSYLAGLDADPARLEAGQQRLAALRGLTRKYGEDATAVLAWAADAELRLAELEDDDERVTRLSARRVELLDALAGAAAELAQRRRSAAARLEAAVGDELQALSMPGARLRVECRHRDDPHGLPIDGRRVAFGASGADEVEILLAPHPGAPLRALHRGASGGELSRVMLALEVAVAGDDPTPTFVFDEVDAGIGGRTAVEIGRRLAALARTAQVVVVTHLAQVAAFADRHLVVTKAAAGDVTTTAVSVVTDADRLTELSRMLGGVADSELGRGHAAELLDLAAASRA